jgi:hypothetical protein
MDDPTGPSMEEELRWDTAASYKVTIDTPWDILRALLLWAIWCSRVDLAFRDEQFHLGLVIWTAWRNTIYCAMEAYKELFRYKRNEEKRSKAIDCFQTIWTSGNIFGRLQDGTIKWNLTPNVHFLPRDLGAWLQHRVRRVPLQTLLGQGTQTPQVVTHKTSLRVIRTTPWEKPYQCPTLPLIILLLTFTMSNLAIKRKALIDTPGAETNGSVSGKNL